MLQAHQRTQEYKWKEQAKIPLESIREVHIFFCLGMTSISSKLAYLTRTAVAAIGTPKHGQEPHIMQKFEGRAFTGCLQGGERW
jgi:hypothetical protein